MSTDAQWQSGGSGTLSTLNGIGTAIPILGSVANTIADQVTGTTPENPLHVAVENTQTQLTLTSIAVDGLGTALGSEASTLASFIARWDGAGDLVGKFAYLQSIIEGVQSSLDGLKLLLGSLTESLEPANTGGNPLDWWDAQVALGRIEESSALVCRDTTSEQDGLNILRLNPYWFYERNGEGAAVAVPHKVGALLRDLCANYQFTPMSGGDPHSTLGFLVIVASLLPVQY